jgi:hypothetical protein
VILPRTADGASNALKALPRRRIYAAHDLTKTDVSGEVEVRALQGLDLKVWSCTHRTRAASSVAIVSVLSIVRGASNCSGWSADHFWI